LSTLLEEIIILLKIRKFQLFEVIKSWGTTLTKHLDKPHKPHIEFVEFVEHSVLFCLCCFLVRLWFKLRASCLQNRHFTAWATPPVHFALVIFGDGFSNYLLGLPSVILQISASQVGRIIGVNHHVGGFLL
jgi:hypothetical protein